MITTSIRGDLVYLDNFQASNCPNISNLLVLTLAEFQTATGCVGDSGGPLVCQDELGNLAVYGVGSYGCHFYLSTTGTKLGIHRTTL